MREPLAQFSLKSKPLPTELGWTGPRIMNVATHPAWDGAHKETQTGEF